MNFLLRCIHPGCGATVWARGHEEPDVNAVVISDDDPMADACDHIRGGDYEIIDSETDTED